VYFWLSCCCFPLVQRPRPRPLPRFPVLQKILLISNKPRASSLTLTIFYPLTSCTVFASLKMFAPHTHSKKLLKN
jgi:hypothetical protein